MDPTQMPLVEGAYYPHTLEHLRELARVWEILTVAIGRKEGLQITVLADLFLLIEAKDADDVRYPCDYLTASEYDELRALGWSECDANALKNPRSNILFHPMNGDGGAIWSRDKEWSVAVRRPKPATPSRASGPCFGWVCTHATPCGCPCTGCGEARVR